MDRKPAQPWTQPRRLSADVGGVKLEPAMAEDETGVDDTDTDPEAMGPGRDFVTQDPTLEERLVRQKLKAEMFGSEESPVRIGRYTVLDKLGEGGMGTVYSAHDDELDRTVAVKVLSPGVHAGQERMQREARAMAKLSHPNIVTVHEVGSVDGDVYVVMELVRGVTLREWLERGPSVQERLRVMAQAARGLGAAHAAGIVHRDFKPENVIVGDDGRVRVLDFGLATAEAAAMEETTDRSPGDESTLDVALTQTGQRLGTPAYMAPEQLLGKPVDARSDQFAFCVALYEVLYGRRPFAGETFAEISRAALGGQVLPPSRSAGAELDALIFRGLSRDPDMRLPALDELIDGLERAEQAAPHEPEVIEAALAPVVEAGRAAPPQAPAKVIAVVLGVLLVMGQVAYLLMRRGGGGGGGSGGAGIPWILMALVGFAVVFLLVFVVGRRRFG